MRDKENEQVWKAIFAYDADDLEAWLERAPQVHPWISALVGKDPYEVQSLETWWESWAGATNPPLSPELLLSGRDAEVGRVRELVTLGPSSFTVSGDSQEEVTAFVAAAIQSSGETPFRELERALIVRTPAAWRHVAVTGPPLILVPLFGKPEAAAAVTRGHTVIVPLGREIEASSGINLPRLRREGIERALAKAGIGKGRIATLATTGRRSLLSLRRALAVHPELQRPQWAQAEHARIVLPAVLAGRWSERIEGDREVLSRLADRPYEELSAKLTRLANASDPPVRRVGDVWMVTAKADAWELLARYATDSDLDRFTTSSEEVIGGEDPTIGLSRQERLVAPLLGKRREHSGHLIEGIAGTLALLSASSDRVSLAGGRRGHHVAEGIVRALLDAANEDQTGHHWIALARSLPLLAEAAPEVFLSAAEAAVAGDNPLLLTLFQDGEGFDSVFGSSAHSSLLWALETLAWSTDHLGRAALVLARLTRLDPGGRLGNRPAASLRNVLLMWRPGTSATLDQRLEVVDLIRRHEPDVAWNLILQLIPSGHDSAATTHSPRWCNWKPEEEERITYAELRRVVGELAKRALHDVGARGDRWAALLARIADLPADVRADATAQLADPALQLSESDKAVVAGELRKLIGSHREFPDADWTMAQEDVDQLEEVLPRLEPRSPLSRNAWLFRPGAFPVSRRRNSDAQELPDAQQRAMAECLAAVGVQQVLQWVETFDNNGYSQHAIGWAMAAAGVRGPEAERVLFEALISDSAKQRAVAAAFVSKAALTHLDGIQWAEDTFGDIGEAWGPDHKAMFLTALSPTEEVWSFAESLGPDVEREYWRRMGRHRLPRDPAATVHAARKLIEHGQPYTAVMLLDQHGNESQVPPISLIAEALEQALHTDPPGALDNIFSHHVDRHLKRLEENGFDEEQLARLEWGYLPLFRYENRQMQILHRTLANEPGFFVQVVEIVYRADGEEPRDLSPEEVARASTARDLLDSWHLVPGTTEAGTIDSAALNEWIDTARGQLAENGRLGIGDHCIGQVLRYGPSPKQIQWPAQEICEVIDRVGSEDIDSGFRMEVYNSRGVTTRAATTGGQQERALAERYRGFAAAVALRWPRTAALLRSLAETYDAEADRHDADADLTQDLWR